MTAGPAVGEVPSKQEQDLQDVQKRIEESTLKAHQYETEAGQIKQEISELSQRMVEVAGNLQDTESRLSEREEKLLDLGQQETELEARLQARTGQMTETLGAMQRLSQQPPELVAFRPDEAVNSLRSASLLKVILPELEGKARAIRQDIGDLQDLRQDIRQEQEGLREELAELSDSQEELNKLLSAREMRHRQLEQATRQERQKLKKFAATAQNLQELIERIEEENRLRENAAREAAKRLEDRPQVETGKETAPAQVASLPSGSSTFTQAKGNIPLPARGTIAVRFGDTTPEGRKSKGITINTRSQATVIAPHDGRVVFSGKFRSYGQLLIISHGDGYHTLLAGMSRLDAVVGQWVLKGEPVGQMASTQLASDGTVTGTLGQKLYLEIRRKGMPINPLPWIIARDRKVLG
ncbi:murein hydrolase activator EnvC family protein [Emcibacter nanhaiensis]|uniref:murein hydrolase activator EnvC family protein n=1 Tax=Emcibacter nanhaiensis TaxID=1505037 RepID=UPI0015E3B3A8|nr:peptidoglycan DD-metalloendopeptidase family protein [Emcibacter nanhaiensis]